MTTVVVIIVVIVLLLAGLLVVSATRRRSTPPASLPEPPASAALPPEAPEAPADPIVEEESPASTESPAREPELAPPIEIPEQPRWRERLSRARMGFGQTLTGIFQKPVLSEEDWEDVEAVLLQADVGVATTQRIIEDLRDRASKRSGAAEVIMSLREELVSMLGSGERTLRRKDEGLTIWVVTGVNGTGKTTTIGKLAAGLRLEGKHVVLAAADTFRAAADEQLEAWAVRAGAEVVKQSPGADPAAVAFDGVRAALARGADVLIVDTAGRLHTKQNLMNELGKILRVVEREAGAPDEVLLVLDATTGQNGIAQARAFTETAKVTGIALTKLDGTAKGGIVLACQQELGLPVKLVGLGEGIGDLAPFDPEAFVDALIG